MDGVSSKLRALSVVTLICVTLWLGFAAAAELCPQVHGPNDYCPVCHLVLVPYLQVSVPVVDAPVVLIERLAPHPDSERICTDYRAPGISRAPPANS
jgi:hypothetical protein